LNSQLVHGGFSREIEKLNMLRIYPVELAADWKLGHECRRVSSEYTLSDRTQLDSTCSVFDYFSTESYHSRRELVTNAIDTARRRRDSTRQLSGVGVGIVHWA